MKRSPIQRRVGLKPGKPPQRKKAMSKSGSIKRKQPRYPPRALIKLRKAWESEQSNCHICGLANGVETHHIALRSQAPGKFEHVANWLWICRPCHDWLHETGNNRHSYLLQCKEEADPNGYDIDAWLSLAGKPSGYLE